mgnify:FL=1
MTKPTNATNIGQIVLTTGITVSISKFHALLPVNIFGYDYLTFVVSNLTTLFILSVAKIARQPLLRKTPSFLVTCINIGDRQKSSFLLIHIQTLG